MCYIVNKKELAMSIFILPKIKIIKIDTISSYRTKNYLYQYVSIFHLFITSFFIKKYRNLTS